MAGPLVGLGAGQQIPLANTLQPNQNNNSNNQQVRPQNENEDLTPETNTVQAPSAPASEVQNSQSETQDSLQDLREQILLAESSEPQERGSIIDISI